VLQGFDVHDLPNAIDHLDAENEALFFLPRTASRPLNMADTPAKAVPARH
jgi:hypothetical protein